MAVGKIGRRNSKKRVTLISTYEKVGDEKILVKRLVIKGRQFTGELTEEFKSVFLRVPLYLLGDIKMCEIPKGVLIETGVIEYEEHKKEYEEILKHIPCYGTFEVSRDFVRARIEVSTLDYSHIVPIIAEAIEKEAIQHNFSISKEGQEIIIEKRVTNSDLTVLEELSLMMNPIDSAITKVQEGKEDSIIKRRYKDYEPPQIPIIDEPKMRLSPKLDFPLEALADYQKEREASRLGAYLSSGKGFVGLGRCNGREYPLVAFWSYEKEMPEYVAALLNEDNEFVKLKDVIGDLEVFTEWKGAHIYLGPVEREEYVYCVRVRGEKAKRVLSVIRSHIVGVKEQFADILLKGSRH